MIVPTTHTIALLLAILTMIAWGSWANTYKLSGKWRFELFYYDYSFGVVLLAVAAAFTLGSMGNELSFTDNFLIAGKFKMALGVCSGFAVNLACILLVAAVSVAGLSVAFPISFGVALAVSVVWQQVETPFGDKALWIGGLALLVVAVALDAVAWAIDAPRHKPAFEDAPTGRGVKRIRHRRLTGTKGIVLSVASGALLGIFFPITAWAQAGDNGLGAYSLMILLAGGFIVSTFIYNVYFLNLPVQGPSLGMSDYFRGTKKQHLLGLLGGATWGAGALMYLVVESLPRHAQPGELGMGLLQAAPLLSALWGLLAWKEFKGASAASKGLVAATLVIFAAGLVLLRWGLE